MPPLRDPKSSQSQNGTYLDMVAIQPAPVKISADVSARESAGEGTREIAREATGKKNSVFACLKEKIEAQHVSDRHYLATGLACFDSALSGGLAHQHVHLMAGPHNDAAATGFIVALLRAQLQQRPNAPIIWCSPRFSGQYGHVCAEGLWAMGLNPGQVIFVHDGHPARLLSAFEEALQTTGVAGVVAEYGLLARKSDQWLRWAQRLRRAARIGDSMGFLLGPPAPAGLLPAGPAAQPGGEPAARAQDHAAARLAGLLAARAVRARRPCRPRRRRTLRLRTRPTRVPRAARGTRRRHPGRAGQQGQGPTRAADHRGRESVTAGRSIAGRGRPDAGDVAAARRRRADRRIRGRRGGPQNRSG